jgi:hypothetical protein
LVKSGHGRPGARGKKNQIFILDFDEETGNRGFAISALPENVEAVFDER